MKRIYLSLLIALSFIFLLGCSSKRKVFPNLNTTFNQKYCIYGLCFHNKPILIDSILETTNYNGLMLKVFDINFAKDEFVQSDSLLSKGYIKISSIGWHEVPYKLKKYIKLNDSGYYMYDDSNN